MEKTDITFIDFITDRKVLVNPTSAKLPLDQPYPFGLIHLFNSQSPNRVHQSDDRAQKEEVCQDSGHKFILANEVPSSSQGNIYKEFPRRRSQYT
jgi:hypothetical protein